MARLLSCVAAALLSAVASHAVAQTSSFPPVTDAVLANPDPADWLMLSRTFDQNRFSPLDQINKEQCRAVADGVDPRACRPARRKPRRSSIAASCI